MSDFLSQHKVERDYYKESRLATATPMNCPYCKRRGRYAANPYELAKRFPSVMMEGVAFCHLCHKVVVHKADGMGLVRVWYCTYCEICICPECQKTSHGA